MSRLERGQLERVGLARARRIGAVLQIEMPVAPRWRGGELARLLDADHAALVERVVAVVRSLGWEVMPEYTFSRFGERGSVDVVAWHAASRTLLIVEVKPRLLDLQDVLAGVGRKERLVPGILARERDWRPNAVGVVLVVADTSANRDVVTRHAATFATAFPARTVAVRRWLRDPKEALRGIWFVSAMTATRDARRGGPARVRRGVTDGRQTGSR